jgi:hypothetical protein
MKLPRKRQPGAGLTGFRKDLTGFPQIVELPNASLKTLYEIPLCQPATKNLIEP